jgi:hypothetical protein
MKKLFVFLVTSLLLISSIYPAVATTNLDSIEILANEAVEQIAVFPHGSGAGEVGYRSGGFETLSEGPTSFFVQNNVFYILDNVNKRILVRSERGTESISLEGICWAKDLYVAGKSIFILDSCERKVYQLDHSGQVLNSYTINDNKMILTGLGMTANKELVVRQSNEKALTINGTKLSGKSFEDTTLIAHINVSNDNLGILKLQNGQETKEFSIPYTYSFGELDVHAISNNQVVLTKTEVSPDVTTIITESFVQVYNLNGGLQGTVRIPHEQMVFVPDHMVRVDNHTIYLLSAEEKGSIIYKLSPGKQFSTIIKDRINAYKDTELKSKVNVQNGQKTESDGDASIMDNTGPNGYIHRGDVSGRANNMINYNWTVSSDNKKEDSGTTLPSYVKNANVGDTLYAIPYKWGGADGADTGAGGRESFGYYQQNGYQTGDVNTNKDFGYSSVTGLDCSGFVGLAWYRTDKKYATSTLHEITHDITKSDLKSMDALNSSGYHTVLYNGQSSTGVYTKESTIDNGGKSQNYHRTWTWLDNNKFKPIRYDKIVDDGTPLPM